MATHYELLGVRPTATAEEIQRAYRLLALRHHPDVAPHAPPETMAAINAAWAVLGDPASRLDYDRGLGPTVAPRSTTPAGSASGWRPLDDDDDVDPEDLDDEPYVVVEKKPADHLVMTPVLLLVLAVGMFFFSLMAGSAGLRTFAILLVPVSGIGFVMAPLIVMMRSRGHSRD